MPPLTARSTNALAAASKRKGKIQEVEDADVEDVGVEAFDMNPKRFELIRIMDPIEDFKLSIKYIDVVKRINHWNKLAKSDRNNKKHYNLFSSN